MTIAAQLSRNAKYYASLVNADLARGYLTLPRRRVDLAIDPLAEAIRWICNAQDASGDGGVARSYSVAYSPFFNRAGWFPSYPETTGYIIPTMFDYAADTGRNDPFERAVRMADWECKIQMPNGAVQGGTVDERPTPAVFNTGQVIFGWIRAYEETGQAKYLDAAARAGNFLVAVQGVDGAWRRHLSQYASNAMSSYTYNTRTAWALLLLGAATGHRAYTQAAIRNIEFALGEQLPNGWLKNNCLHDPVRPLVHTIAYSLRGILEVGVGTNNATCIAAAQTAADALLARQRRDGTLAGRYDENWDAAVSWSCLTGNAQMALVWGRLHQVTGQPKYVEGVRKANRFLRSVQWAGTGNPGLDGGISGSYPLHGPYGRFEVVNWAVKFFADSLMLESAIAAGSSGKTVTTGEGAA